MEVAAAAPVKRALFARTEPEMAEAEAALAVAVVFRATAEAVVALRLRC